MLRVCAKYQTQRRLDPDIKQEHSVATLKMILSFEDATCCTDITLLRVPCHFQSSFSFRSDHSSTPCTVADSVPLLITNPSDLPILALSLLPENSHI